MPTALAPKDNATKWIPSNPVEAYILAKQGLNDKDIAASLKITQSVFICWKKKHPELKYALEKGREDAKKTDSTTFEEYVYERLPKKLQELWDKISYWFEHANGIERIHTLLHGQPTRIRQHLWLHAMISSNFNASDACQKVGVSRRELLSWENSDPDFPRLLDELQWHKKNFYEGALADLAAARNPMAIIFANRTLNNNRGYSEKIGVAVAGNITHTHNHSFTIDQLKLPLEVRCAILDAMQKAQQEEDADTVDLDEPVNLLGDGDNSDEENPST